MGTDFHSCQQCKRSHCSTCPCYHGLYSDIYKTVFLIGVEALISLWIDFPFLILCWQLASCYCCLFYKCLWKFYLNICLINVSFELLTFVCSFVCYVYYVSILCWWSNGLCLNQSQAFSSAIRGSASTLVWLKTATRVQRLEMVQHLVQVVRDSHGWNSVFWSQSFCSEHFWL
jgi:hypothetical protein